MLTLKYRIKLKSGRIVGPFVPKQIGELYFKNHIDGTEDAQVFPGGAWERADTFPELLEQIVSAVAKGKHASQNNTYITSSPSLSGSVSLPTRNTKDKLALPKASDLETQEPPAPPPVRENFKEFKYAIDEAPVEIPVDYEQLEKNYQQEEEIRKREDGLDRTRVKKIDIPEAPTEKTVVRPNAIPFDLPPEPVKPVVKEVVPAPPVDVGPSASDKTQVIVLQDALSELKQKAQEAEVEIEQKILEDNKQNEILDPPKAESQVDTKKSLKKKAMKPIVFIAFIAIFIVLLFPETDQKLGDLKPEFSVLSFPIPGKFEDNNKAANELKEGIKLYNRGTYKDRLKSAEKFRSSLEAKFQDNPQALGWLVLNYAELLPNTNDRDKGITNLFRLIQLARGKVITDINVAMGTAIFYGHIKKYATALTTIENFLRVKNKPSSKLFAIYLDLLIKNGRWVEASKVFQQLSSVTDPPSDSYLPMSKFLSQAGRTEEAKVLLEKGLKRFPNSVPLFLEYCSFLLSDQNFKIYETALNNLKKVSSENAPSHVAKYLEYMGMLAIIKKNQDAAATYFKKALAIQESDELRSKLSSLEIGGSQRVEALIRESKILDLISKSKAAENERRWDDAYKLAIDASDLAENYIPAQLWLSYIQTKRGYFNSSILTLEKLQKDNPNNANVNFSLISTYIEARKFDLVQRNLGQLSGNKLGRTSEYAFQMGSYYRKTGNYNLASKWFNESITIYPVNDKAYFELAELLFESKKFDRSRFNAGKAIELDPENSAYHGLMAKILYETENAETAIGYLRDVLESKVDDPYLIGEIAIHYQRSGRLKEFELYQKKFQELSNPTSNFYDYMIYVSRLNDNAEQVIKYGTELLKINPGAMEIRLAIGEYHLKKGNLKDALEMFMSVKERLPTYPRVNYWIAKVFLQQKDYARALAAGQEEIKFNPVLEHGHYIVGETYKQQQKYPEALLSFEKALSLNGSSIETLFALAWIKHRQNYPNIARDFYAKILKLEPSNAEANKQMGFVFKDLGQGSLAIEYLKIYLDLNPGAEDRNQIESQIRQLQ